MDLVEESMQMIGGCSYWLALNPPNMCSMVRVGYAMFLSEYLLLELCLMVELTFDSAEFSGT